MGDYFDMDSTMEVLQERGSNYGRFEDQAMLAQRLKQAMWAHSGYTALPSPMMESLEMIQHKIARIINGNPKYKDSWTDIGGYARLIEELLDGNSI